MRRSLIRLLFTGFLVLGGAVHANQAPGLIGFQGIIKDGGGTPINGTYNITFTIYTASSSGTSKWSETQNSITVTAGAISVILGSSTVIPDSVFREDERWLELSLSGGVGILTPRIRFLSMGYSLRVNTVNGANGGAIVGSTSIGTSNTYSGTDVFVAGNTNTASGNYSSVGGGLGSTASGVFSAISGGTGHEASGDSAAIGGGSRNHATGDLASIGGGKRNVAGTLHSVVAGGDSNVVANVGSNQASAIGGGEGNLISGNSYTSFIGGGSGNTILGSGYGVISGGVDNHVDTGIGSVIVGGETNRIAHAYFGFIGTGFRNIVSGTYATIGGGGGYYLMDEQGHLASGQWSTIAGGRSDTVSADYATIAGGNNNDATAEGAFVGGGEKNTASGAWAAIGGGINDTASGKWSVVSGGKNCVATDTASTIGGGGANLASGKWATIAGGRRDTANAQYATIAGGENNRAKDTAAFIGAGSANLASGKYSGIVSGLADTASGAYSMVPGGEQNKASGNYSFAGGRRAKATHLGAFVWADSSANTDFTSSANNQFNVRAAGGTRIYSNAATTAGVTLAAGGGTWASVSDSTKKRNIREVNGTDILNKLEQLPIKQWSYKSQDASIEHIGPMAQDFYALFHVGDDDTTISSIDPSGIALAATKELHRLYQNLAVTTEALNTKTAELDAMKAQLAELQKTVQQLVQASGSNTASGYGLLDKQTTKATR